MKRLIIIIAAVLFSATTQAQKPDRFFEGGRWGLRDSNGKVVAPAKYNQIFGFHHGLAEVSVKGEDGAIRWGFIDTTGVEIVKPKYFKVKSFSSEGLAAVEGVWEEDTSKRRWGFIDTTGAEVIKPQYRDVEYPAEGLIAVGGKGGYGYIDKTGEVIIPLMYFDANGFNNGLARVHIGGFGSPFYIDKTGTPEAHKEPLSSYIQQVVAYKSRHSTRSSGDFQIAGRYLVIRLMDDTQRTYLDMNYPDQRAAQSVTESITDDINTLVFHYIYRGSTRTYYNRTWGPEPRPVNVTSYGSHLIYFDLRTKKVIGHDKMRPPKFTSGYSVGDLRDAIIMNNYSNIKQKIESHLTPAEQ